MIFPLGLYLHRNVYQYLHSNLCLVRGNMKFLLILPLLVSTVLSTFLHHHGDCEGHSPLVGLFKHKIPRLLEKIRSSIEEIGNDHNPAEESFWMNSGYPYYYPQLYPPFQGPPALIPGQPDLEEESAIIDHEMKPVVMIPFFRPLHPYNTKPPFESSGAMIGRPGKVDTAVEENIKEVFTEEKSPLYPSTVVEEKKISTISKTGDTSAYKSNVYPYVKASLVEERAKEKYFPVYPKLNRIEQINYPTALLGRESGGSDVSPGLGIFNRNININRGSALGLSQVDPSRGSMIQQQTQQNVVYSPNSGSVGQIVNPSRVSGVNGAFNQIGRVDNDINRLTSGESPIQKGFTSQTTFVRPSRYPIQNRFPPRGLGYFQSPLDYYKRPNFPYYGRLPFQGGAFQRYPSMGRLNGQEQGISNGIMQGGINGRYPSQVGIFGQNNIPTGVYQQYPTNTGGILSNNPRGPVTFESRFKEEAVESKNSTEVGGPKEIEEKVFITAPSTGDVVNGSKVEVVVEKGQTTIKASDKEEVVDTKAEEVIETGGITEVISSPGAEDSHAAPTTVGEGGDIESGTDADKVTEVGDPSDIMNGVDLEPVNESDNIEAVGSIDTESGDHSENDDNIVEKEYVSEIAQSHGVSEKEIDHIKLNRGLEPSNDHPESDLGNDYSNIQTREISKVVGDPRTISFTIELPPKTITTKTVTQMSEHKLIDGTEVSVEPIQRTEKVENKTLQGTHIEPVVTNGPNGVQISFASSKDAIKHGSNGSRHGVNHDSISNLAQAEIDVNNQTR